MVLLRKITKCHQILPNIIILMIFGDHNFAAFDATIPMSINVIKLNRQKSFNLTLFSKQKNNPVNSDVGYFWTPNSKLCTNNTWNTKRNGHSIVYMQ